MWQRQEFLSLYEDGVVPLLKGDIVEVINPKLKSFGLQGTIVIGNQDDIYCVSDFIIPVEVTLDNKTKVIHTKNKKENLKFITGDRPSFGDHFDTSPVHVGRYYSGWNDDIISLFIVKPLFDSKGDTVPGFIELHHQPNIIDELNGLMDDPMVSPLKLNNSIAILSLKISNVKWFFSFTSTTYSSLKTS